MNSQDFDKTIFSIGNRDFINHCKTELMLSENIPMKDYYSIGNSTVHLYIYKRKIKRSIYLYYKENVYKLVEWYKPSDAILVNYNLYTLYKPTLKIRYKQLKRHLKKYVSVVIHCYKLVYHSK